MIPIGWNGQILWVDLSEEKVSTHKLDSDIYKKFIGGKGLGTYLLYKNLEAGVDPLGPDNILFLMTDDTRMPLSTRLGSFGEAQIHTATGLSLTLSKSLAGSSLFIFVRQSSSV